MPPLRRCLTLLLMLFALAGCVPWSAAPSEPTVARVLPVRATPTPEPPFEGWRIALSEAPVDLYPYNGQRAADPILALLYPPPVLPVSGGSLAGAAPGLPYTSTGVLLELPTFENGGVVTQTTTVFLDAGGVITTTQTEVTTEVEQLVVTYRWNPALRWSDGRPVTAEDSLFAYELARASDPTPETVRRLELTERYEALDLHTSRAFLPPGLHAPDYLLTAWLPLPSHTLGDVPLEQVRRQLSSSPLGYGPYSVDRYESGQILLARRPDASLSYPSHVQFRFVPDLATMRAEILAGTIDIAVSDQFDPDQLPFLLQDRDNRDLQLLAAPGPVWEHLDINLDRKPFDDPRVRHALALGLNRNGWSRELFGDLTPAMDSWIAADSWAYSDLELSTYSYDPEQAALLLDEIGLLDHDGDGIREVEPGVPLTTTLLTSSGTGLRQALADRVGDDLGALGISVSIESLPTSELYSPQGPLFKREFGLALFGWLRAPDPDGAVLWSCAAVPGVQNSWVGNNFAGWCNLDADQALRQATSSTDLEQRLAGYATHQRLFSQDLPVIPIFARPLLVLAGHDVRGLQPDAFAPLVWNLRDWSRDG